MNLSDAAKDATPGPWEYDEAWSLIIGPKDQEIAALHAADDPAQKSARERKETVAANAYLISRARALPQLVEALEEPCQYHHLALHNGWAHVLHADTPQKKVVRCRLSKKALAALAMVQK